MTPAQLADALFIIGNQLQVTSSGTAVPMSIHTVETLNAIGWALKAAAQGVRAIK
jgi:hypothetical protein